MCPCARRVCARFVLLLPRSFQADQTRFSSFQSHKQTTCRHFGCFTRNRTRPTIKINPFLWPKTRTKATGEDGWDAPMYGEKRGKIRPAGTISREVMRRTPTVTISSFSQKGKRASRHRHLVASLRIPWVVDLACPFSFDLFGLEFH